MLLVRGYCKQTSRGVSDLSESSIKHQYQEIAENTRDSNVQLVIGASLFPIEFNTCLADNKPTYIPLFTRLSYSLK